MYYSCVSHTYHRGKRGCLVEVERELENKLMKDCVSVCMSAHLCPILVPFSMQHFSVCLFHFGSCLFLSLLSHTA